MGQETGEPLRTRIRIKVHPRAKRTRIAGRLGDIYKLDIAAPPSQGRANEACVRHISAILGVKLSSVRILQGLTNELKLVEISGISPEEVGRRLAS